MCDLYLSGEIDKFGTFDDCLATNEERNQQDDILDNLLHEQAVEKGDVIDILNCSVPSLSDEVEGVFQLRRIVK